MWTAEHDKKAAAMKACSKLVPRGLGLPRSVRKLVEAAAERHQVRALDVVGAGNYPASVAARRDVAHQLRSWGMSLPEIGRLLGGRHHTTIMHYLQGPLPFYELTTAQRLDRLEAQLLVFAQRVKELRSAIQGVAA